MTPAAWEIALWAHERYLVAKVAADKSLGYTAGRLESPCTKPWIAQLELYAEIMMLSIYADEAYGEPECICDDEGGKSFVEYPHLYSKTLDPHALLAWLKAKKEASDAQV